MHREGAAVLYAAGTVPGGGAGGDRARRASRGGRRWSWSTTPTARPAEVRAALRELAPALGALPALVLATGPGDRARARLEPDEALVLEPLDAGPCTRRRVGAPAAPRLACARTSWSAPSSSSRRCASASAPAGTPWCARSRGWRPSTSTTPSLLRARAARRRAGRAAGRRAAARHRRAVRQRQVVGAAGRAAAGARRRRAARAARLGARRCMRPGEHPLRALRGRPPGRRSRLVSRSTSSRSSSRVCRDEAERAAFVDALVARARPAHRVGRRSPSAPTSTARCAALPRAVAAARRQPRARRARCSATSCGARSSARAARRPARRARARRRAGRRRRGPAGCAAAAVDRAARAVAAPRRARLTLAAYERTRRRARRGRAPGRGGVTGGSTASSRPGARILLRLAGEGDARARVRRWPLAELDATRRREVLAALPIAACVTVVGGRRRGRARGAAARVAAAARLARGGRRGPAPASPPRASPRATGTRRPDPGELYRGARLAAALDWVGRPRPRAQRDRAGVPRREPRRERRAQRRLRRGRAAASPRCWCSRSIAGAPRARPARHAARRGAPRPTRSGSARTRSSRTTSTARCCSRARASRSTTRSQTRGNLLAALLKSPAAIGVLRGDGDGLIVGAGAEPRRAHAGGRSTPTARCLLDRAAPGARARAARHGAVPIAARSGSIDLRFSPDGSRLAVARRARGESPLDARTQSRASPGCPSTTSAFDLRAALLARRARRWLRQRREAAARSPSLSASTRAAGGRSAPGSRSGASGSSAR